MIIYQKKNRRFAIQTPHSSYIMAVDRDGRLRNLHYGEKISHPEDTEWELPDIAPTLLAGMMLPFRAEYPTREKTLYAEPCLFAEFLDGTRDVQLIYQNHIIRENTLIITMKDRFYSLEVDLHYTVYEGLDLISKHAVIRNTGKEPFLITKAKSGAFYPARTSSVRLLHMAGCWGKEYQKQYITLNQGRFTLDNTRGNCASHQHIPFFALDDGTATETQGRVWYGLLHWSGDFKMDFEIGQDGQLIASAGVNDFILRIGLQPKQSFETPLFTMGFTDGGYEEMSRTLYDFQYDHLMPQSKAHQIFPIIYNTWYPYELDVNEEKCLGFIEKAHAIGAELFVIDDGWFGRRKDTTDGLGDWWCDPDKFPRGLRPIADKAHALGMKFGLWVEPEMVNEKSDLFRQHPNWILSFPNRESTKMRNQYVLNLARKDVMEFAWETVDRLISEFRLDYIKWDMNSYIMETAPGQYDLRVRYIQNLYEIWRRMNEKYPHVLFENCAAGGSRADYGMAPYSDRINRSDNSDPVDVLKIHEGFSTIFPPRLAGGAGNVATCPHHLNGRITPLGYRALLGMTGSMSIGVNLLKSSPEELDELKKYIAQYKSIRHIAQNAYLYRLSSAFDSPVAAWEYLGRDRKNALLFIFANGMNFRNAYPRLLLRGLDEHQLYRVTGEAYHLPDTHMAAPSERFVHGDALMRFGLRIEPMGDYFSQLIQIEAWDQENNRPL